MKGHLILLVSVPGGGKTVLLKHLQAVFPQMHFAVSCTTRTPRPDEKERETYYFVSTSRFRELIEEGAFVEWAEIDGGNLYGTLRSEILTPMQNGEVVIREVEIQGAATMQKIISNENLSIIFIDAGEWKEMADRITKRAPISEKELEHRRLRYKKEQLFITSADFVVENHRGQLESAKKHIEGIVKNIINKTAPNKDQ